jgi:HTH-type transcriptional regulator/antitoxin HigA
MMTMTMTAIKPIKTDADHEAALREIDALWGAPVNSSDGDRLDVLVTLVEAYESGRWPLVDMDPVEALECVIRGGEHSRGELAAIIGQSRATEVLKRQRALTLPMIRSIAKAWQLPIEVLARSYRLEESTKDRRAGRRSRIKIERMGAHGPAKSATVVARHSKTGMYSAKKADGSSPSPKARGRSKRPKG